MRRALGWVLIIHAFAHSSAGVSHRVSEDVWAYTPWMIAVVGYVAAGLGLLRVPTVRRHWKLALLIATIASMHLQVWYRPPWSIPGLAIDLALFIVVLGIQQPRIDAEIDTVEALGASAERHPHVLEMLWGFGVVVLAYVIVVVATRPTSLRWGSTSTEREALLPGDEVFPTDAEYRIDHAITVHASASEVWPWLVQLGQDRGGFYSYDWLERAIGADIHNADRIHAEWQTRRVDDTVFATQPSYLGGRLGRPGWRVEVLQPNRVIGLEKWGTFVLQPIDSTTTRLMVRTRGAGSRSALAFALAPINVFVFEPAHFIMERAMLRGIRARAEGPQS